MLAKLHTKPEYAQITQVANSMQLMLRESPTESMRLANRWKLLRSKSDSTWQWIIDQNAKEIERFLYKIEIEDENILANYLSGTDSGIVLSTLHMGDYLLSGLRLLIRMGDKKVIIPRRKVKKFNSVFSILSAFDIDYEVVPKGPGSARYFLQCLRKGNIVILPYDLSQGWGKTATVDFMGRKLNWVIGPAYIAYLSQAVVVPFYTTVNGDECKCHIDQVLDLSLSNLHLNTYFDFAQHLVSLASRVIRTYPEQWHHWNLIPEMLSNEHGLK